MPNKFTLPLFISRAEFKKLKEDRDKHIKIAEEALAQVRFKPLIRGIGHELQNSLGIIISGMDLIGENLDNPKAIAQYSDLVKNAMMKLSDVANALIHQGSTVSGDRHHLDLNKTISDITELAKGECRKRKINIVTELHTNANLFGDESSIFQAIIWLLYNSLEAIEKNGTITINTYQDTNYLTLTISDTRTNTPPKTTPSEDLSTVEKVIQEHNGKLNQTLPIDGGKIIKISFPTTAY